MARPHPSRRTGLLGASTIYTIAFAYAGASLLVLLVLTIHDRPVLDLISSEDIAEEIVRILASGIGLVLAVPITTAIAAATAAPFLPASSRSRASGAERRDPSTSSDTLRASWQLALGQDRHARCASGQPTIRE